MRSALSNIDGVQDVAIDFDEKTATVSSDRAIDPTVMIQELQNAGFGGSAR